MGQAVQHRSARILTVELTGALRRRREDGTLSAQAWSTARRRVTEDQNGWLLVDVDVAALAQAESIAEQQRVRALDAIHLGTAVLVANGWPEPLPFSPPIAASTKPPWHWGWRHGFWHNQQVLQIADPCR
ncbi:MAG: hypothetical protein EPN33_14920 [Acidobacteria bacterium]|nr:MAG: hypothetical protein EPN33_14920 [Acidobacteriota bacterium]